MAGRMAMAAISGVLAAAPAAQAAPVTRVFTYTGDVQTLQVPEGVGTISVGAAMNPEERINAGRLMIPMTWFDAEKCAGGLERLRGYRKRWNRATRS